MQSWSSFKVTNVSLIIVRLTIIRYLPEILIQSFMMTGVTAISMIHVVYPGFIKYSLRLLKSLPDRGFQRTCSNLPKFKKILGGDLW